jgi:hypothetical protein
MVNLIHEPRINTNVIYLLSHQMRDSQYTELGMHFPTHPFYMGTGLARHGLNMPTTPHLAYFDGTTCSVS